MSCFVLMAVNEQMFWLLYWFWSYVQKKKKQHTICLIAFHSLWHLYTIYNDIVTATRHDYPVFSTSALKFSVCFLTCLSVCLTDMPSYLSGPLCIIKCAYRSVLQPHCVLMFLCLVRAVNREHYDSLFVCLPVLQPVCLFIYQLIHSFIVWPVYLVFSVGRKPCCRASL